MALVHILLLLSVGSLVYSGILHAPFVFDDLGCVFRNPAITELRYISDPATLQGLPLDEDIYRNIVLRPIAYLSFAWNYRLHGYDVFGYHLFNVAVHLLNALLVYFITLLTLNTAPVALGEDPGKGVRTRRLIALFTALLFVCHPLQSQAVTYITQRFTSLSAFFVLLSLALYIKFRVSRASALRSLCYLAALMAAYAAMQTKESAFTLPLIIVMYELIFFRASLKQRLLKLLPFLFLMPVIPLKVMQLAAESSPTALASLGQSMNLANYSDLSRWDYLFTQFRVVVTYLRLLLLPVNQNVDHDIRFSTTFFEPSVVLSCLFLVAMFGVGAYLLFVAKDAMEPDKTRFRLISFGVFWFFVTLSVESSVIPLEDILVEHRVYLPLCGPVWALVVVAAMVLEKRRAGTLWFVGAFSAAVIAMSALAYARNNTWRDPIALWSDTARKSPDKARPYLNLGALYFEKGMFPEALEALTTGLRLAPDAVEARVNIANVYLMQERYDEAEQEYLTAIKAQPENERICSNLGRLYLLKRDHPKALPFLLRALKINPYFPEARLNLAELYELTGQRELAIAEYQGVLQQLPDDPAVVGKLNLLRGLVRKP